MRYEQCLLTLTNAEVMYSLEISSEDSVLLSRIGRALNLAFDVVSFAEEGVPIIKHFLVLV